MLELPKHLAEHFKECVAAHLNIHSDSESDSDSGQSSFDEEYYNLKPPPVPLDRFEKLTVIDDLAKSPESVIPKNPENKSINSSTLSQQNLTGAEFQENKNDTDSQKLYSEILKNSKPNKSELRVQKANKKSENSPQSTSKSIEKNISPTNIDDKLSWNKSIEDATVVNISVLQKDKKIKSGILYSDVLKTMPSKPLVAVNTKKSKKFNMNNVRKPTLGHKNNKTVISTNNTIEGKNAASSSANNKLPVKKKRKRKINPINRQVTSTLVS